MVYKERKQPLQLQAMNFLKKRKELSRKEMSYYLNLVKGFEGECLFDSMTEKLICDCFVLNDLLLRVNGSMFQIDTLILTGKSLLIYEVKNFEGEYVFEKEQLTKLSSNRAVLNPTIQLARSKTLVRQLLDELGCFLPIQAYVAFVHPRFTLYQAPVSAPILLPTMLESHFEKLNKNKTSLTHVHKKAAEKLCGLHLAESPYINLPVYDYDELQKGIFCLECSTQIHSRSERLCICDKCGRKESVQSVLVRHIEEYKVLFPESRITTAGIHDWCGLLFSTRSIRRLLRKEYTKKGSGRGTYYV